MARVAGSPRRFKGTANVVVGRRSSSTFTGDIDTPLLDKRPNPPAKELRVNMLQPDDVTDCVMLAVNLPERVVVEELVVRPRG